MSHDSRGQATSTQSTIIASKSVAGQAASASYHNDGSPNIDTRTDEDKRLAALANIAAQAKHGLPEIEQCKPVPGQANPNASSAKG